MQLEQAKRLVRAFESGTLPKEQWTHTAHFIMALWYCITMPLPEAVDKIRKGIIRHNLSVGGENSDTHGYHETITLFYTSIIAHYVVTAGITALTDEQIGVFLQQPFLAKDYPLKYYSKELLMSRQARHHWVDPDRMSPPGRLV